MATAMNLYTVGRVTGASGILKTAALKPRDETAPWKSHFVGGLLVGGAFAAHLHPELVYMLQDLPITAPAAVAGGALVGWGSSKGCGCTSGHGVSGLARFSKRSLAAVCTFLPAGMLTATAIDATPSLRSLFRTEAWGRPHSLPVPPGASPDEAAATALAAAADAAAVMTPYVPEAVLVAAFGGMFWLKQRVESGRQASVESVRALVAASGSGMVFAGGLALAGMTNPGKVLEFLTLPIGAEGGMATWDPSLMWVMAGASAMAAPFFTLLPRRLAHPALSDSFKLPTSTVIDRQLIMGSAAFGAGWGISGMCPAPGLMAATTGAPEALLWLAAVLAGMRLHMATAATGPASTALKVASTAQVPAAPRQGVLPGAKGQKAAKDAPCDARE